MRSSEVFKSIVSFDELSVFLGETMLVGGEELVLTSASCIFPCTVVLASVEKLKHVIKPSNQ